MGPQSANPAKGGIAAARLGAVSPCSAAGQPGRLSSPQWPSTAPVPTSSARRPVRRPRWRLSSLARGGHRPSAPFSLGKPRFSSSPRLQIRSRAPRLPLDIAAPVLHRPGFPVAALLLGTRCRSLPLPPLGPPVPGGPLVLPRAYSPPRSGNLSPLRVQAVRAPSSGSLSRDLSHSCILRLSARSLRWLQRPCRHQLLSHLPVGAPSSGGGSLSRAPPGQWPSLSVGPLPVSLLGGSLVPSPGVGDGRLPPAGKSRSPIR